MEISKKEIFVLIAIAAIFLVLRLPGVHFLYHQDEYKWPIIVNPALTDPGGIPHPPVGEFIYREFGKIVGYDNFRVIPLLFSFLNFFLLFYLVKNIFDAKTALWSAGLFAVSFYSVLASLMVDTDGAVMPLFFLTMAIGYVKLKKINFQYSKWLLVLALSAVLGFLTKTSFIIPIAALALDFAIEKNVFSDKKRFFKYFGFGVGLGVLLVLVLLVSKLIFPFFNLQSSVSYWEHFFKLADRGWLQTSIQFAKSLLYASPLLILPLFLVDKEIFKKTRVFFLFIALGLLFYLVLFDFSTGALDRYFQFLVVPLCVIAGAVFAKTSPLAPLLDKERGKRTKFSWGEVIIPILISTTIFSLQFFPHFVPSLHPKTEWLQRILHLDWQFLFPFTGGSGPTGFYVSFLFIALIWAASLLFMRRRLLFGILILGLMYNAVFTEEYLWGKINGSPYGLFAEAKIFIEQNENIKSVVVYNDIGGYEIQKIGKYARRLYVAPQFETGFEKVFSGYNGHLLFIDIPRIDPQSLQSQYIKSCGKIYEKKDGYITSQVLDCSKNMF